MARRVVYLNLLPDVTENAVQKLANGLGTRYKRNGFRRFFGNSYEVVRFDVFNLLKLSKLGIIEWGGDATSQRTLNDVIDACRGAWKIWVSAHGHMDCVDYVYGGQFNPGPLCSWEQMCEFLTLMLPRRKDEYKIELMVCYGARSSDYLSGHQGAMSPGKLSSSLAYKIFKGISNRGERQLVLTARTGATGMDENLGCVTVEQDEHVELDYERRHILETPEYKDLDNWWKKVLTREQRAPLEKYAKMKLSEVEPVPAATEVEKKAKKYWRTQAEYRGIRERQHEVNDLNRYGTIRYITHKQTTIEIKNLYTGEELYRGAWLA